MVTILIPTYYGNQMLVNCIASIFANVSKPDVRILKNDIGFVKACNKMIAESNDDVILLNDDTVVLTDLPRIMEDLAKSDKNIGIIGGLSLSTNRMVINYGIEVAADGNTAHKYYGWREEEIDFIETQKAVEGSCMYIKREVINKISIEGNFFDENYGMGYREELDSCLRAREAGYKIVSSPNAKYIHYVSQTNSKLGITNDTYDYFMSKWKTKLQLGLV